MHDESMLTGCFGADPVPLAERKREWHRQQLELLEGYLAGGRANGAGVWGRMSGAHGLQREPWGADSANARCQLAHHSHSAISMSLERT